MVRCLPCARRTRRRPLAGLPVRLLLAAVLVLPAAPALADNEVLLDGAFDQGALLKGMAPPGSDIRFDGSPVRVAADGRFLIGFGRDDGPTASLDIRYPDGSREDMRITVNPRQYQVQHIKGLPRTMVTPDEKDLTRIYKDAADVKSARQADSADRHFETGFIWPVDGTITGVYGSQRILNGEPRRPHFGIDIAAPKGTPVVAVAAGTVTMATDLYFTGGTVIIEHGHGLNTTYSHLDRWDVAVGQTVAAGERIGTVGSTGRSTGPHLDLRANLKLIRLDPLKLLPPRP